MIPRYSPQDMAALFTDAPLRDEVEAADKAIKRRRDSMATPRLHPPKAYRQKRHLTTRRGASR